jgi:hypothetical protein
MIFLFRLSDIFLAICIFIVLLVIARPPGHPPNPFWPTIEMIFPFLLYVLWRARRPIKWMIGTLIFASVFSYALITGLVRAKLQKKTANGEDA